MTVAANPRTDTLMYSLDEGGHYTIMPIPSRPTLTHQHYSHSCSLLSQITFIS